MPIAGHVSQSHRFVTAVADALPLAKLACPIIEPDPTAAIAGQKQVRMAVTVQIGQSLVYGRWTRTLLASLIPEWLCLLITSSTPNSHRNTPL
jgi:hypothetical protein